MRALQGKCVAVMCLGEYISMAASQDVVCNCMSSCVHINMHFSECSLLSWGMLQDVSSIYLWSCTSAFSAIEPSAAVSQGKLTSLLIALLVITECSWSSAVSSLRGILSLRLSFLRTARSTNALQEDQLKVPYWPQAISVTIRRTSWLDTRCHHQEDTELLPACPLEVALNNI